MNDCPSAECSIFTLIRQRHSCQTQVFLKSAEDWRRGAAVVLQSMLGLCLVMFSALILQWLNEWHSDSYAVSYKSGSLTSSQVSLFRCSVTVTQLVVKPANEWVFLLLLFPLVLREFLMSIFRSLVDENIRDCHDLFPDFKSVTKFEFWCYKRP